MKATSLAPAPLARASLSTVIRDYVALTKPRIILLLVVTAIGSMFLAARGTPSLVALTLVTVGGSLAAAGANALNQFLDRDIDERMGRTRRRPLPGQRIEPWHALVFGLALNLIAFILLAQWVNLLSALLTLSATVFYALVYTQWLKRSTVQNIVIGGAAGAIPPMVGWAAVTGGLALPAFYMFAIIFFWTPPHFWALSLLIKDDYARAGVPMLPVVHGFKETTRGIILHAFTLVAVSALFYIVADVGLLYLSGALVLGAIFLAFAARLLQLQTVKAARNLYLFSLLYLALLFVLIAVDGAL